MDFTTKISNIENGLEYIRGYALVDLVGQKTFVEGIYLLFKGKLPEKKEVDMLNALLLSCIDHGVGAPSTTTARIATSTGNSLHTALAAGILTLGTVHGSAIQGAAQFFLDHSEEKNIFQLIEKLKKNKVIIPGFGHKILTIDHRALSILELAKDIGFFRKYSSFAQNVEEQLGKQSKKTIPLNIDGAMAAILLDMGFELGFMQGFFILGRIPGLIAHIYEQSNSLEGIKRLSPEEEKYVGPKKRVL
jgi:citryl-CoA lyase